MRVLITGVSKGLGQALALGFASSGASVCGCSRNPRILEQLRKRLRGEGHRLEAIDVADDSKVCSWAAEVRHEWGTPDLLINNAALINQNKALWEVGASEFDQLLQVNLGGVANIIRHYVPAMISRGSGVIVNFSSGWGRSVSPEVAPYCATKWGIEGLTKALAMELPSGMAAVALNPGVIHTDMLQRCFGSAASRYPTPEEWGQKALPFLLGLGPGHNGQSLTVPS